MYLSLFFGMIREGFDLFAMKWTYFASKENILQLATGFLVILFIIVTPNNVKLGSHFAAWSVFAAWLDLTLLIGRIDYFGEYIFMATTIARRLMSFMFVYVPSFFAFAFAFNILLHSARLFRGPGSAILKTLNMALGELEFGSYFAYYKVDSSGGSNVSVQVKFV